MDCTAKPQARNASFNANTADGCCMFKAKHPTTFRDMHTKIIRSQKRNQAGDGATNVPTLYQTFAVNLENGLHARPCALLVKTLRPFHCRVDVEAKGALASGHSIMSLMVLAASYQTKVTFIMTGEDAAQALTAVQRLFYTHFEDVYPTATDPARTAPVLSKT